MKYKIHGAFQLPYKFIFSAVFLLLLVILIVQLITSESGFPFITLFWVVLVGIIMVVILNTRQISFDNENIYIGSRFSGNEISYPLDTILKIKVSFSGYFSTIHIKEIKAVKKYSVFNSFTIAIKYNKMDALGFNRKLFKSESLEPLDRLRMLIEK